MARSALSDFDRRAALAALGLGPEADGAAAEAAFRAQVGPLSRAAATDPEASERLRELIAARRVVLDGPAAPPSPSPPDFARARASPSSFAAQDRPVARGSGGGTPQALRPLGFRLLEGGRGVAARLSLDALTALAANGAREAMLDAPVLRRCPTCRRAGHAHCAHCSGAGVVETGRVRRAPLDLARLAANEFTLEIAAFSDAVGRAARREPRLVAELI